jgi:aspartate carbamoyltransferase catalytic subunit
VEVSLLKGKGVEKMLTQAIQLKKGIHSVREMSASDIERILDLARDFKAGRAVRRFSNKTVALFFCENSTRTKLSFELAAQRLGANVLDLDQDTSSILKGESLKDTVMTLEAMGADCIVIRHSQSGITRHLQQYVNIPIINAGDGWADHPSQSLLDLMTISEYKRISGLKVLIAGDVLHSRVARSNKVALEKLGAKVEFTGPLTLMPPKTPKAKWPESLTETDVLILLRLQKERQKEGLIGSLSEYHRMYGLTEEHLKLLPEDALILHPGPVNRGVEVAESVLMDRRAKVLHQVANGVYVRMALISLAFEGSGLIEVSA